MKFVYPSIVMMIFTSVYGIVDGVFVSNIAGETPFAAINLTWPFIMLLAAFGFMAGTGGNAVVSKAMGEGDNPRALRYFSMVVEFTVIIGTVIAVIEDTPFESGDEYRVKNDISDTCGNRYVKTVFRLFGS